MLKLTIVVILAKWGGGNIHILKAIIFSLNLLSQDCAKHSDNKKSNRKLKKSSPTKLKKLVDTIVASNDASILFAADY